MSLGEFIGSGSTVTKGLYHLNGNANDSSGNGNNGVSTNITWVGGRNGSGAASFNGSSSKILCANNLGFATTGNNNITVSTWFNIASLPASGAIQTLFFLSMEPASGTRYFYRYYIRNNAGTYSIYGQARTSYTFTPTTGVRYNFIFTTNTSQNNNLYLNGDLVASGTANDSSTGATGYSRFAVGMSQYASSTATDPLNGKLDEVIVENRAWTAEEIRRYYTYSQGKFAIL